MHKKNFGAVGAMAGTLLSHKTWGGGGGLGDVAYKDPPLWNSVKIAQNAWC